MLFIIFYVILVIFLYISNNVSQEHYLEKCIQLHLCFQNFKIKMQCLCYAYHAIYSTLSTVILTHTALDTREHSFCAPPQQAAGFQSRSSEALKEAYQESLFEDICMHFKNVKNQNVCFVLLISFYLGGRGINEVSLFASKNFPKVWRLVSIRQLHNKHCSGFHNSVKSRSCAQHVFPPNPVHSFGYICVVPCVLILI